MGRRQVEGPTDDGDRRDSSKAHINRQLAELASHGGSPELAHRLGSFAQYSRPESDMGTEAKQQLVQAPRRHRPPAPLYTPGPAPPYAASPDPASPNPASPYPTAHSLADPLAVQAALELLDDNRSFRALVCDFQMLCRATAPPPREAMQTTYFII